ncbi:RNase adapter RapZ [Inmirania thermothiophila]|uniref:UPF0042 nucleotide-binding protein n=1 Tax=Inmirania thermothiophila TaxID=1750597 RepID=A0A3N1XSX7_9GAMM|nr:RNase adapter RapZ [Inmirania thermothiophila]ROR29754.1 UPF0042 nucleotide-binding protein [Inmirania thermothiophila]
MRLVIVSGLSGSGKSTALHTLEDLGYYCVDNLPLVLLHDFATGIEGHRRGRYPGAAAGIDARNVAADLRRFPEILAGLRDAGVDTEVVFLTAGDEALVRRFAETRRPHPLAGPRTGLREAIQRERRLLAPVSEAADLFLDTTGLSIHQLRDLVRERVARRPRGRLSLLVQSFAYRQGVPADADLVFDARCLPNPHWVPELRPLTGRDEAVARFLDEQPASGALLADIEAFLGRWIPRFEADNRPHLAVAVGCTGGRHRSVYVAERLAQRLRAQGRWQVLVQHRELKR